MGTEYDPFVELASAIVAQAVEDYSLELADLELNPKNGSAALEARRLEKFFHSGWYGMLTNLDPDQLIAGVRVLAKKAAKEKQIRLNQSKARKCMKKVGEVLGTLETQDEFTPEQQGQLKELCQRAVDLTEEIPQLEAEAEAFGDQAIMRMGMRVGNVRYE